ncbi:MAG: 4-hydroxy-tetrahydrodipicolinate reductase [Candidatus Binatia bacterium]|nr:MAG: 4-hydroxy-tetrahydrodipicolinate reductase [Candidatus Binatia bacterium]
MPRDIVICGAAGRMGREILRLLPEHPEFALKGAVERPNHPLLGQDAGSVAGISPLGVRIHHDLESFMGANVVVVDFSSPEASLQHLRSAVHHQAAIVIGTTGFSAQQTSELDELADKTRCLVSSNMSLGIAVLTKLAELAALALKDSFDIEIVEMHHRHKVDAPSGTALTLADAVARVTGTPRTSFRYGREGRIGPRARGEIGILALRGGDVVGDHTVVFAGGAERIELVHRAQSRECFARGALKAASWLCNQPVGRYSIRDMLGI